MHGSSERRDPHWLFDSVWYLHHYSDETEFGHNPLLHFITHGAGSGYSPHPLFDLQWYCQQQPLLANNHENPLSYYLCDGRYHGQTPHPLFDSQWYLTQYPEVAVSDLDPLTHYLEHGIKANYNPHPLFDACYYLQQVTIQTTLAYRQPIQHYLEYGAQLGYQPHPLFDGNWYLTQNADVAVLGINPLLHFIFNGAAEGRNPHPLFDTQWYLEHAPDLPVATHALIHYVCNGAQEGRSPHPLFDANWYQAQFNSAAIDLHSKNTSPLAHYITHGAAAGYSPHPLFNAAWYLKRYPDIALLKCNPLIHYLQVGAAEGRQPHPLFDPEWYLTQRPELAETNCNLLRHYLTVGAIENLDPHPVFDSSWYLERSPDLAAAGINPLVHFITAGADEGRNPHPLFDCEWYLEQLPLLRTQRINPLEHYLQDGGFNGYTPHPLFDSAWYLEQDAALRDAQLNPLVHYLRWGAWEGRNPHPLFDSVRYLNGDEALRAAGFNPLVHYLLWGGFEGRDPHPLFDSDWYLEPNPALAAHDLNPLVHYLRWGANEQRNPHPLFHSVWYSDNYRTQLANSINPLVHYVRWGAFAGCDPNPFFRSAWYLEQDEELKKAGINPLLHYLEHGGFEGRNPSEQFDSQWYFNHYPDAAYSGLNPLVHYVLLGANQGYAACAKQLITTANTAHSQLYEQLLRTAEEHHDGDDYIPEDDCCLDAATLPLRLIAFYLPQFHPIPENDHWWGKGFTEWTNVAKAVPQYDGHYQPRLPDTLGFYDLRVQEIQREQIRLVRKHGIYGFCYYYYWFDGKKLLERPLTQVLNDPTLDLPFCLCWANENWTRRWDGGDETVLIGQNHCPSDDLAFIADIAPILIDSRYIRIGQRPLLLVYRPQLLPTPAATAIRWREFMRQHHQIELFLVAIQSFEGIDPTSIGFDAASEFPPHQTSSVEITAQCKLLNQSFNGRIYHYQRCVEYAENKLVQQESQSYVTFPGVMVNWDNTARRLSSATIFAHATPDAYRRWLNITCQRALAIPQPEQRIGFINAWNEWAEGTYLEPDRRYGFRYLQITRDVLNQLQAPSPALVESRIELINENEISVVLPVYNGSAWLTAALDSLVNQTVLPRELVIINDGSTDESQVLIDQWIAAHLQLPTRSMYRDNQGAHAAINTGVALSRSAVITIINQDDVFHPQRLERLLTIMQNKRNAFVFSMVEVLNDAANDAGLEMAQSIAHLYSAAHNRPTLLHAFLSSNLTVTTGNHCFTQDLFIKNGGYKHLRYCHDWDFALTAFFHTHPVLIDQALYQYRIHDQNSFHALSDIAEAESQSVLLAFYQRIKAHPALLAQYFGNVQQLCSYAKTIGHDQLLDEMTIGCVDL
nr:glycoside hydrolase family 99-like domain-containing protein [Thiospirillum jenense]